MNSNTGKRETLQVAMAQMAPVWLDKARTLEKICDYISQAAKAKCRLVVFGEALLPGYPFWLSFTHGSKFESQMQKEIHAHYIANSISIEKGDLEPICRMARENSISIYLGCIERATDRGGHSLYCSLLFINEKGQIQSVHRKLQPTYEERLAWAPGDGNGLTVHDIGSFKLGGLNCWENWMPLARTALYGQGENVHIAVWPGAVRNMKDIIPFIAREGRSFVISVSGIMHKSMFPTDLPYYQHIYDSAPEELADGGSCICRPNGEWLIPPIKNEEGIFTATLELTEIYQERQNFDSCGHYSRPDVTKLILNKERQQIIDFKSNQNL